MGRVDFRTFNLLLLFLYGAVPLLCTSQRTSYADGLADILHQTQLNRHTRQVPYNSNINKKTDNHKPKIVNCTEIKANVDEEQEQGTHVYTIRAVDEDEDDIIKFRFQQKNEKKFKINETSGEITTNTLFDRDEVTSRQKEMYITVIAADNGRPPLFDVCTFKIIINDINDNQPLFDKTNYSVLIPQDLQPKKEVMRIYATDSDDGKNSEVEYGFDNSTYVEYIKYFDLDVNTGIITLKKPISPDLVGQVMYINAYAKDHGVFPQMSETIRLEIKIVDSNKKAPSFTSLRPDPIYLFENYSDYNNPIVVLEAVSNIQSPEVTFQLVNGRTESTNHQQTFRLNNEQNKAKLMLGSGFDYETITEYILTVRVSNNDKLTSDTKIVIRIKDVNDNIPSFMEIGSETQISGSVLENKPPNTPVTQVQASDKDGTSPNNKVTYELADHQDKFSIDPNTGEIRTKVEFDREEISTYTIKVKAKDGAPSALLQNGLPNEAEQVFRIEIDDINDNAPKFTKDVYIVDKVDESTDANKLVLEVKAIDKDTASDINYIIIEGNEGDAFAIDKTGKITVKSKLDYETRKYYELKVRAYDFSFEDFCIVKISIRNENDEAPLFTSIQKTVTIEEESLNNGYCLMTVHAIDPDKDPGEPQGIMYSVTDNNNENFLSVDENGCILLTKPLDRDPPNGRIRWQSLVSAFDGFHTNSSEFDIILTDVNDNAPFLKKTSEIWMENEPPSDTPIINLIEFTDDYDDHDKGNGPPYKYYIASTASEEIRAKFEIRDRDGLYTNSEFDREVKKEYVIPINISDNGQPLQWAVTDFTVVIGDINDNPMRPGKSEIFVNKRENTEKVRIGRVFVEDLDDWDLPDKTFRWRSEDHRDKFDLNQDTGVLTLLEGTEPGDYELQFTVTEQSALIDRHEVDAVVVVHVKVIPDEAIERSGSIRLLDTTAEEFITETNGKNQKDMMQAEVAKLLNVSYENVDILSILHSPANKDRRLLDVRYSVHASPYHYPEELNTLTTIRQKELQFVESIFMINIAECLDESICPGCSCMNYLRVDDELSVVNTNRSSYVGVSAVVEPRYICADQEKPPRRFKCLNGGVALEDFHCDCEPGFGGRHCEALSVSFIGNGYALYPPLETCNRSDIVLQVTTSIENGLIFYVGPLALNEKFPVRDFMSLEIKDGYPVLLLDYGNGTASIKQTYKKISDGETHTISILFNTENVQLNIDNCHTSDCIQKGYSGIPGPNKALNVNGPLQLGGSIVNLKLLASQMEWTHTPTDINFIGCISNFTYNGFVYNLGQPGYGQHYTMDCNNDGPTAAAFGIDTNFIVALLVCLAILLILLLAVVVHRRKHDHWNEKELDDIRETIINYEDEGGGEVDTGFDLELLRRENQFDDPYIKQKDYGRGPEEVPDINGFLKDKKEACDKDPDFNPYDDVRYYAFEGDGNTSRSSLSSLASCTDEGDLKFNYLSNFGPRFRKLADMYGEDPSDEEDNDGGEESWC